MVHSKLKGIFKNYVDPFSEIISPLACGLRTRVMFSKKKIIFYGGNFNTIFLFNQKVDVHHIKRSKDKELGAIRPQRPKFFLAG